jgi:uncharacterized membrane protein YkoI
VPLAAFAASQHDGRASREREEAGEQSPANAPQPKVSEAQARSTALAVAHGTVAEGEYEYEDGGWRWSFDIRENGRIHEVGVNAMTGKIVEDAWESADDEQGEAENEND